jgi:OPA family glycerol-3-phosphate transporter-like MFS transporter
MAITLDSSAVGWVLVVMTLSIIAVHGMLSGTASMDFGGRKNTGVAVGIIDGFVYLGTAVEALVLKAVLPRDAASRDPAQWWTWPAAILPVAVVGFALALRVWNAKPRGNAPAH